MPPEWGVREARVAGDPLQDRPGGAGSWSPGFGGRRGGPETCGLMREAEVGAAPNLGSQRGCQGSASECGMKQDNNFVGSPEGSLKEAGRPLWMCLGVHGGRIEVRRRGVRVENSFAPPVALCPCVAAGGGWEHVWDARF